MAPGPLSLTPTAGDEVCPRCGSPAAGLRFCGTCGLNLEDQGPLPTRHDWERRQASLPWPRRSRRRTSPGWSARHPRLRSLIEVGLPLVAIGVVALIVLSSGGRPKVPGGLTYDARAKPLLKSLRAARQTQLNQEHGCRGCMKVAMDAGGCSGALAEWACDVQASTGARGTPQLETFRVRWNQNGCWSATEDCVSPLNSIRRFCPPAKVEQLQGCIHAPA